MDGQRHRLLASCHMRRAALFLVLAALAPYVCIAAEPACEQSEASVTPSPQGGWAASVQHQVCDTGGRAAAAVTVFVGPPAAPLQGSRVAAVAVPRSRDEWPRAFWRSESRLEIWVPNLASVLETAAKHGEVTVVLRYCDDDPAARAQVAQYAADLQAWMAAVSRWSEQRKTDPEGAGARPERPQEPRVTRHPCTDLEIAAAR